MKLKRFAALLLITMMYMTACGKKSENESLQNSMPVNDTKDEQQTFSTEQMDFVQEIYDTLRVDFTAFNRLTITNKGNWDEEILDENGNIYFQLTEEKYQKIADVRDLLERTFSDQYIEDHLQWVLNGEYPMFKEIDGALCIAMLENIVKPLGEKVSSIDMMEDKEIIFVTEYTDEEIAENITYRMCLTFENEQWVIDDYQILE